MRKPNSPPSAAHYDANYGNFRTDLYAEIRAEAFGEDIGQNSWLTADEQDIFLGWLGLSPGSHLLDVGCGAGGPVLRIAEITGCSVTGIDVHDDAVVTANSLAAQRGLTERAQFRSIDASTPLPFSDASFDAVICIDAINHFSDRLHAVREWARLLKPGGRLLFTDPITVTGPLANQEIAVRSASGYYVFVPVGYDELILEQCGFQLAERKDVTANMARLAQSRYAARASRSAALLEIEGDQAYQAQQQFLEVAARLAREARLSRFVYLATKLS